MITCIRAAQGVPKSRFEVCCALPSVLLLAISLPCHPILALAVHYAHGHYVFDLEGAYVGGVAALIAAIAVITAQPFFDLTGRSKSL